jgi:hypothetical protein
VAPPWAFEKQTPRRQKTGRGVNDAKKPASASGGNLQLRADMQGDLGWVEKNEVADFVIGDAPELGPRAERSDRRPLAGGKYPALAKADDVGELTFKNGR